MILLLIYENLLAGFKAHERNSSSRNQLQAAWPQPSVESHDSFVLEYRHERMKHVLIDLPSSDCPDLHVLSGDLKRKRSGARDRAGRRTYQKGQEIADFVSLEDLSVGLLQHIIGEVVGCGVWHNPD
ncbi:hypothetical protein KSP40_PGU016677 [Platanthera guangdongensis]|uniref:Uncharacterized protein n=1 Tax=Platanthera guangdongensis TaxID=2320717 RepID=A0ABR2M3C9_9ASPA